MYTEDFVSNCDHIYFDIGSNVGVQIRKLYEPLLYPDAKVLKIFDEAFGATRDNVCAIGIEPNPVHTPRLQAIEAAYRKKGWRVVILTESAASNEGGTLTFKHDASVGKKEWGNRAVDLPGNDGQETYQVTAVNIAAEMKTLFGKIHARQVHAHRQGGGQGEFKRKGVHIAKIDIEGGEYKVLPALALSGMLCHLDQVFIEFHAFFYPEGWQRTQKQQWQDFMKKMIDEDPDCHVKLTRLDDETYLLDGKPLPT